MRQGRRRQLVRQRLIVTTRTIAEVESRAPKRAQVRAGADPSHAALPRDICAGADSAVMILGAALAAAGTTAPAGFAGMETARVRMPPPGAAGTGPAAGARVRSSIRLHRCGSPLFARERPHDVPLRRRPAPLRGRGGRGTDAASTRRLRGRGPRFYSRAPAPPAPSVVRHGHGHPSVRQARAAGTAETSARGECGHPARPAEPRVAEPRVLCGS